MMDDGRRGYETWSEGRADWRPEKEGGNPDDGRWTIDDGRPPTCGLAWHSQLEARSLQPVVHDLPAHHGEIDVHVFVDHRQRGVFSFTQASQPVR